MLYHDITVARMTLQMGPRLEFQTRLQLVIGVCFDTLEDNVVWNDSRSLRLLSQALAHLHRAVRGTKILRAARIMMSAYFSILEPAENSEGERATETAEEDANPSGNVEAMGGDPHLAEIDVASSSPTATAESDNRPDDLTEEAESNGDGEIGSNELEVDTVGFMLGPRDDEGDLRHVLLVRRHVPGTFCKPMTVFKSWERKSLYLCIDCNDTGFCEVCYAALQADKDGTAPFEGRRFCGRDQEHIKAPIEGWRGIKDGVMRIDGDEDVPFKEFLRSVREELCKEAWDKFWEG